MLEDTRRYQKIPEVQYNSQAKKNPKIEGQTRLWPEDKGQKDKQQSTQHYTENKKIGLNKLCKFTLLWLDFVIFFANSFNVALVV
jgi:hypothetical protein